MRKQVQEEKNMKNKTVKALAIAMTVATVTMMGSASIYASDDTAETAKQKKGSEMMQKQQMMQKPLIQKKLPMMIRKQQMK